MQAKPLFSNATEAAQFALGLKLFSEVMLPHRLNPLAVCGIGARLRRIYEKAQGKLTYRKRLLEAGCAILEPVMHCYAGTWFLNRSSTP